MKAQMSREAIAVITKQGIGVMQVVQGDAGVTEASVNYDFITGDWIECNGKHNDTIRLFFFRVPSYQNYRQRDRQKKFDLLCGASVRQHKRT